jgi:hypothetical protein
MKPFGVGMIGWVLLQERINAFGGWMDEVLERNKNLNRGFRKLRVWREAIDLYVFIKEALDEIKRLSFKIKDQILDSAFSIHSNTCPVK